jgi:hypothetical protein
MLMTYLLFACGSNSPTEEAPQDTTPTVEAEQTTPAPPVTGDPMSPASTTVSSTATAAEQGGVASTDLTQFAGTWTAIQPKSNRQAVHSICGTKAQTMIISDKIIVETAFDRAEQSVVSSQKDDSGMTTVTLSDGSSTLKLSESSGVLTATGWSNDGIKYVREGSAQNLERIAIFEDGCPNSANTDSPPYQEFFGEWIPSNEYKCAKAVYTLSQGTVSKGNERFSIVDISSTDPIWLTVKAADDTLSGISLSSSSGYLSITDGTGDWELQRLKKRDCTRPTPSGIKKTVPPGLRNRVPKARGNR